MNTLKIRQRPTPDTYHFDDSLHPVLQRILAARGITSLDELDHRLPRLLPWQSLKGINSAVDLLVYSLQHQESLLIVADFDADGATSCAVGIRALQAMGIQKIHYLVPDRAKHGYGLTPVIADLAAKLQPDLLITVDNGISSIEGVKQARAHGMKVLITDHHLPGEQTPEADAIVNPNQVGDQFPSKSLAGVGVIFYLMIALRARLRELNWFEQQSRAEPNLAQWLDLVALGSVADVVALDQNNRILVNQGLLHIRKGQCCPGIEGLIKVAGREQSRLNSSDLGFYLGPRINAAGRMDDMRYGIECLLDDDPKTALDKASQLDIFNQERRAVESEMLEDALEILQRLDLEQCGELPLGLCLFDKNWHQGVIGILASRIKDRWHRPVIIFTSNEENPEEIKGSARSIPGFHIRDGLANIHSRHPQLLSKFGGHAMAAGLSLHASQLEHFQTEFDLEVRRHLNKKALEGIIDSDGSLPANAFTIEFAELLRDFTPWGQAFPEPVFDGNFEILEKKVLKNKHLKMRVQAEDCPYPVDAIAFGKTDEDWHPDTHSVHLVYRLDINQFRGFQSLQLMVQQIEPY
ncbi:single-stranded-DNA-specific exonuclease RecJ [Candidatus Venteria ishoeyi]|uniref:single-stranded-DNA-specific exonuclease RecJ n=1 Tax=Candidatus Venteria ishoeyi TaxID=1899563 RepID=UPI0025A5B010|nr:single-stranded-DNA-specific exonuclease RecJ [Candidatus Venteria ishoeyi]MDM8547228.1 single-stranded-DNA-specific exonuclease RecJ [Candidatus Venteria ishoeyi]